MKVLVIGKNGQLGKSIREVVENSKEADDFIFIVPTQTSCLCVSYLGSALTDQPKGRERYVMTLILCTEN